MRKLQLVVAAAMLVASSTVAVAQDAPPAGQRQGGGRGMNMQAMMTDITLTAEQQAKMDSVTKKYADMRTTMQADQSLDPDARRAKGTEMRNKQMEEMKAILTDDQKKVFEKNMADMAARGPGGGRPPTA